MQDTLKILESVNHFYSQSFNQLIVITVAVLAFAGVVMPVLIYLYQKRLFRLEHEEIRNQLKDELNSELAKAIDAVRKEYKKKEEQYLSKIECLDEKIEKEIAGSISGTFHLQGIMNLKDKRYLNAFVSLTKAAVNNIKADDEINLRRQLGLVIKRCLPKLNKLQLERHVDVVEYYEELFEKLSEYNMNNRYTDEIRLLKIAFKQAMERELEKEA
ncbi:hypothetical protein [Francisella philomiragia]|uniref:Uncharacterized protein n=1 Tax=Francisella philomiragia TaxID=28110 RepID=A0ABS1GBB6_9GAMM|nr:hypothetical protein [Francisella philomiragia]MBK2258137.1 hypothetical protein [Francisella philomiragia]MBK2302065.1 hypothetical protein [Francisella philomiragia]